MLKDGQSTKKCNMYVWAIKYRSLNVQFNFFKQTNKFRKSKAKPFSWVHIPCISPWFRYVSVSSCSLTAGDVAVHSTYWNGGFLVSFSGGMLESSCLKIGRASTSLRGWDRRERRGTQQQHSQHECEAEKTCKKTEDSIITKQLWELRSVPWTA